MICFSSFYHKIMFSAVKNAKAVLISYFHGYNSFSYAEKKIMAYVHQLLDQPSQWQTSKQAAPGTVPKFTSTSITVKQLLIKNKNINQSKSSLLIWHYVSYLFLFNLVVLFFLISRLLESDHSFWSYLPLSDENFTLLNLNISEASWPILIKFYV